MSTVTLLLALTLLLATALVVVSVLAVRQSRRARREARQAVEYAFRYANLLCAMPHERSAEIHRKAERIGAETLGGRDLHVVVAEAWKDEAAAQRARRAAARRARRAR